MIQVKIDTKEKFHVINILSARISGQDTDYMTQTIVPFLQNDVKNIILQFSEVEEIDRDIAATIFTLQERFYAAEASFVICAVKEAVLSTLPEEIAEQLNIVPTESEAWDIVQMEEIERELLGGLDD